MCVLFVREMAEICYSFFFLILIRNVFPLRGPIASGNRHHAKQSAKKIVLAPNITGLSGVSTLMQEECVQRN